MKYLLAISTALLISSSAIAEDWTKDEASAGLRKTEYTRRIPAGKQRTLDYVTFLNVDCTPMDDVDVSISREPEHGAVTLDSVERLPSGYAKDNPRSKCDKKVKSQAISYKPGAGFVGDDGFEVTILHPNGMASVYVYRIKVLGSGKGSGRADIRP